MPAKGRRWGWGPAALMTKILLLALLAQMPDLTGVTIRTEHVGGNIYMLEASGDVAGNIGVSVGEDGILIVDDQFAPLTDQKRGLPAEVQRLG